MERTVWMGMSGVKLRSYGMASLLPDRSSTVAAIRRVYCWPITRRPSGMRAQTPALTLSRVPLMAGVEVSAEDKESVRTSSEKVKRSASSAPAWSRSFPVGLSVVRMQGTIDITVGAVESACTRNRPVYWIPVGVPSGAARSFPIVQEYVARFVHASRGATVTTRPERSHVTRVFALGCTSNSRAKLFESTDSEKLRTSGC